MGEPTAIGVLTSGGDAQGMSAACARSWMLWLSPALS